MRRRRVALAVAVALWAPSAAPAAPKAAPKAVAAAPVSLDRFVPQWEKGDRWLVRSERREDLDSARPGAPTAGAPRWSKASVWLYRVVGTRDERGIRFFQVLARNWRTPPPEEAAMLFAGQLDASGRRVTSLALIRAAYRDQSKELTDLRFDGLGPRPFPILNEWSSVPGSFPVFRDGALAGNALGEVFEVTDKKETLAFAKDVRQTVGAPPPGFVAGASVSVKGVDPARFAFVTLNRQLDGLTVRQVWHQDLPWFAYEETRETRAWFVKHVPARPAVGGSAGGVPR